LKSRRRPFQSRRADFIPLIGFHRAARAVAEEYGGDIDSSKRPDRVTKLKGTIMMTPLDGWSV
jgi:hypothetical protein